MGVYRGDADRRVQQEAQGKFLESQQKIQLLSRALKQYEDLHVDVETQTDAVDGKNPGRKIVHLRFG